MLLRKSRQKPVQRRMYPTMAAKPPYSPVFSPSPRRMALQRSSTAMWLSDPGETMSEPWDAEPSADVAHAERSSSCGSNVNNSPPTRVAPSCPVPYLGYGLPASPTWHERSSSATRRRDDGRTAAAVSAAGCATPTPLVLIDIKAWRPKPAWRLGSTVELTNFATLLRKQLGGDADLPPAENFRAQPFDDTAEAADARLLERRMRAARRKPARNYQLSPRKGNATAAACDDCFAAVPPSPRIAFGGTYQPTPPLSTPDVCTDALWPTVLPPVLSLVETGRPWTPLG